MRLPYITSWNFGIEHAFSANLTLDVSYVGNHGTEELGTTDPNSPTPGAKNSSTNGLIEQARRPYNTEYPWFANIPLESNLDESNYDGLQATLVQRLSRGLSITGGYTYAHALDYSNSDLLGTLVMNSLNPRLDYGNSDIDIRNRFTLTGTYILPGRKVPGQLLEGWKLNSSVLLISALPTEAIDSTSDISGTGQLEDRWTLAGNPSDFKLGGAGAVPCWGVSGSVFAKASNCSTVATLANMPALCQTTAAAEPTGEGGTTTGTQSLTSNGCYMMGSSVIVPPAQGTFGTMPRNELRKTGLREWDMSVLKDWKIRERLTTEFRAEFYNILNRTNYGAPGTNPDAPTTFGLATSAPNTGSPVVGNGGPRQIQFGLKFIF
jgi:hypothetical protein